MTTDPTPAPTPADQLTVAQLAVELGVSKPTALRRVKSGAIRATKLPGRTSAYLIDRADLDEYRRRGTL